MEHLYLQSAYREKALEHVFIADCLKALWRAGIYDVEILRSEVDAAGYDLVVELGGTVRHIQLKSTHRTGRAANQKLNGKLAGKPSGCAVWLFFDAHTLELGPFLWFGNGPGEPLRDLSEFRKAKHVKANAEGVKAERQNSYVVPKGRFEKLEGIEQLLEKLFGAAALRAAATTPSS